MDYYNFIIDFDFNKVRIYKYDCGIVLSEEDLAVVSNKSKPAKVLVGGDATGEFKRSLDKNTCIIKSVKNGRIEDLDTCAQMLNMLLAKVEKKSFRKKRNIVFLVPCGLTKSEQDDYISLGYMLSANNIRLITKIQGISKYNALKDKLSTMIIHMGEDYLDVGVVYNHSIVKGYTIDLGVKSIADNIAKHIINTKNIEVTASILNQIKKDMATILPNDNIEEKYLGINASTRLCEEFKLSSLEVVDYYKHYICEVCDIVDVITNSLSKDIVAELKVSGIVVSGELASITGLNKFMKNRLNNDITISSKEAYVSMLGIGSCLNDIETIENLSIK